MPLPPKVCDKVGKTITLIEIDPPFGLLNGTLAPWDGKAWDESRFLNCLALLKASPAVARNFVVVAYVSFDMQNSTARAFRNVGGANIQVLYMQRDQPVGARSCWGLYTEIVQVAVVGFFDKQRGSMSSHVETPAPKQKSQGGGSDEAGWNFNFHGECIFRNGDLVDQIGHW